MNDFNYWRVVSGDYLTFPVEWVILDSSDNIIFGSGHLRVDHPNMKQVLQKIVDSHNASAT